MTSENCVNIHKLEGTIEAKDVKISQLEQTIEDLQQANEQTLNQLNQALYDKKETEVQKAVLLQQNERLREIQHDSEFKEHLRKTQLADREDRALRTAQQVQENVRNELRD